MDEKELRDRLIKEGYKEEDMDEQVLSWIKEAAKESEKIIFFDD